MSVQIELPVWYVDDLQFDDLGLGAGASYFEIFNRKPEPNQTGVKVDSLISFQLVTDAGDAPVLANVEVRVTIGAGSEQVAFDASTFQSGWDGPGSASNFVTPRTLQIDIDPVIDFPSQTTITVRVIATSSGAQALDETYTFDIEDRTTPILSAAVGRAKDIVRVTFNEPVNQDGATVAGSSLNPSNYAFSRVTRVEDPGLLFPSVPIVASLVEAVDASTVDITLDQEMTPGTVYTIVATGVEDVFGNVITAPDNEQDFGGFIPARPDGRDFDAWRMIPRKNRDEDAGIGDLRRMIEVFKEVCALMLCDVDEWTDIIDPDKAPEVFLDAMLCDLGNPFEFDLDVLQKRKLVQILVDIYRQKGTGVGIINAIRFFLGIEVEIVSFAAEGWELGIDELSEIGQDGTPPAILGPGTSFAKYSFEVIAPVILTDEQREQIKDIVDLMKPAHTHCVNLIDATPETPIDHIELGLSFLGFNDEWDLHE